MSFRFALLALAIGLTAELSQSLPDTEFFGPVEVSLSDHVQSFDGCAGELEKMMQITVKMETASPKTIYEFVGRFCNSLRTYANCMSSTGIGSDFMELITDLSPEIQLLCESGLGDLFIDLRSLGPMESTDTTPTTEFITTKIESTPTTESITTEITTTPTTESVTTEITTTPTTESITTGTTEITTTPTTPTTESVTTEITTTPTTESVTTEITTTPTTVGCNFTTEPKTTPTASSNDTTTQPSVDPTENPTEPRDTDCFKPNLRTHGTVLKQVRYSSDEDCKQLCYTIDGCQAVVTSPMYWYWIECFVIGDYYLSTNDAVGWDTAERTCFDPDFDGGKITEEPVSSTTEPGVVTKRMTTTPLIQLVTNFTDSGAEAPEKDGCEGNKCIVTTKDIVFEKDKKLTAENKEMNLIMERNGNIVLYCKSGKTIWESGTKGASIGKGLVIQTDGNMLLYSDKTQEVLWKSGSDSLYERSEFLQLVAQNDNNLVLYDSLRRPLWATDTVNQCKEDPKEGDCSGDRCVVLANGKDVILAPGESITAENGEITLLMQTDGNLVLYCPGGVPVWHSDTWYWETENHKLVIKNTGEMVVVDRNLIEKWSSYTDGNSDGVTLVAQNDNNLVLYTKGGVPIWQSNTWHSCY